MFISTSIANYKTFSSYASGHLVLDEYSNIMREMSERQSKSALKYGFIWGAVQAFSYLIFAMLYLATGLLYLHWSSEEIMQVNKMYTALFCIIFGILSAS